MSERWVVAGVLAAFGSWAAYVGGEVSGAGRLAASPRAWAERVAARWPALPRDAARLMTERCGPPQAVAGGRLEWGRCGPYQRVVVRGEAEAFALEGVVEARVPEGRLADLERFGHGVWVYVEAGELAARGDDEPGIRLSLNLAHDIIAGARTPEQAARFYSRTLSLRAGGKSSPYLDRLLFTAPAAPAAFAPARTRF